jgi:Glycosyltransferase 61
VTGVVEVLRYNFDLQILPLQDFANNVTLNTSYVYTTHRPRRGYIVERAQTWANMVADYYELTPRRRGNNRCDGLFPRIGILNRAKSRTIDHVDRLVAAMRSTMNDTTTTTTSNDIAVHYFENASFVEQVQFFMDTDILISPHGAQLTGIPFLTTTSSSVTKVCSQLMEIFPPSYVLTDFFGTLAAQSHIPHSYMYFEQNDDDNNDTSSLVLPGTVRVSRTVTERKVDRQRSIQILVDDVVKAVGELIEDWQICCRQK